MGSDALPPLQQFILFVAEMIRNAFLQQNAFDPTDKYCSPEKQIRLLKIILDFYQKGGELVKKGITVKQIAAVNEVSEMVRLKSEVSNREPERFDHFTEKLMQSLNRLDSNESTGGKS